MEKVKIDFHLRLDKTPSLRELYLFKVQAKPRGLSRLSWPYFDGSREYSLTINTFSMYGLIGWDLNLFGKSEESLIWSKTTSDVVHVFNVVRAQCDHDARAYQSTINSVIGPLVPDAQPSLEVVASLKKLFDMADPARLFNARPPHSFEPPESPQTATTSPTSPTSPPSPPSPPSPTSPSLTSPSLTSPSLTSPTSPSLISTTSPIIPTTEVSDSVPMPSRIEPTELNQLLVAQGAKELRVLTYPELLFHLKREILRHSCTAAPYSLVLMKIRFKEEWEEADRSPLNVAQSAELVKLIYGTKRPKDLVGVHRSGNLALILPGTDSVGTNAFVDRLSTLLRSARLPGRPTFSQLKLTFACASVPENCTDVSMLLQTAESGLLQVSENRLPIVAYSRLPLARF